ncbi:MAG: HugZ family protein [Leptolyngbya sp. SIO1D8]|nr:HugZ family protein [Leptolyngbya sp. SIO1D8]
MASFSDIQTAYLHFPERLQSLMLSTLNADGQPHASYAPFVMGGDRTFYIFVSGLSTHTKNLMTTSKAGILLIEDEAQATQIFARQRLMYDCQVDLIERQNLQWTIWADKFAARFGNLIDMLRQLPDFQIFSLIPQAGRFVVGFGAAYEVDPSNLEHLIPVKK